MRQDQLLELLKTSPNGKKVYVTNNYSDTVSVVDTETDTQTGAISDRIAGGTPLRAAFSRDGIKAYVVNYGSVLVINAEMDASEGTVPRKNTRSALREEMDPRATRTHTSPRKATGGERAELPEPLRPSWPLPLKPRATPSPWLLSLRRSANGRPACF